MNKTPIVWNTGGLPVCDHPNNPEYAINLSCSFWTLRRTAAPNGRIVHYGQHGDADALIKVDDHSVVRCIRSRGQAMAVCKFLPSPGFCEKVKKKILLLLLLIYCAEGILTLTLILKNRFQCFNFLVLILPKNISIPILTTFVVEVEGYQFV